MGAGAGVNGGAGVAATGTIDSAPSVRRGVTGAMDRITDLDPGWQYVVEVCELVGNADSGPKLTRVIFF